MDSKTVERWAPIPAHPTHEASDLGRIRRIGADRCLTPSPATRRQYLVVDIDGRTHYAHRLVAAAHLGDVANKVVHHQNGCCQDNRLENLELTTHRENMRRAQLDKSAHVIAGESCPERWGRRGHLTATQVRALRRARETGKYGAIAALAREYGVSTSVAYDAASGLRYCWVAPTALETELARQEADALRAARKVMAALKRAQAARDANPPHTPPAAAPRSKSKKESK